MLELKEKITEKLKKVLDPELNISIIDLGLVYDIKVKNNNDVKIIMTLTTIGCPLFPVIENNVKSALKDLKLKNIAIVLTFDPPWPMDKMSETSKHTLGF